jgi:amino acid adenylation domain-containing protein
MSRDNYPHYWEPQLIHHYFLQHARLNSQQPAIISPDFSWTYEQLEQHANRYKEIMLDHNICVGDKIILELNPCPQAVALIIACSMIGAAFVPVSPDLPLKRVEDIIEQTEARLYIQSGSSKRDVKSGPIPLMFGYMNECSLDIISRSKDQGAVQENTIVLDTDLAYIIFTSGTTGKPKGIMMSHKAALTFFKGLVDYCGLSSEMRVGTVAPLQFDFSLLDMGLAFGSGTTLVQVPRVLVHNPKRLVSYLNSNEVYQMNGVPSIWSAICLHAEQELEKFESLRSILYAGEFFPINNLRKIQNKVPSLQRIINCFGQSESIACSFIDVPNPIPAEMDNVPIGFAHPGAEILLINSSMKLVNNSGEVGEIYLRGSSLFSGYWRNEEITRKVLMPNPLRPDSGERVFKTGDMAYVGADNKLYYSGRSDSQVQVMGNRVELEEIERVICSHPLIKQAVVVIREREISDLVAFIVPFNDERITEKELRLFCSRRLPQYMLPAKVEAINDFPLTVNGKVDRGYLLERFAQLV